jgi:hypothetical protein
LSSGRRDFGPPTGRVVDTYRARVFPHVLVPTVLAALVLSWTGTEYRGLVGAVLGLWVFFSALILLGARHKITITTDCLVVTPMIGRGIVVPFREIKRAHLTGSIMEEDGPTLLMELWDGDSLKIPISVPHRKEILEQVLSAVNR